MSHLCVKTIGDASPQGKPRVLFVCHPEDFSLYSERVFREILSARSCAIYYINEADEYDADLLLSDLSQMQLFVFAVSKRLLTTPSRAMDMLFPFAEQNHIPVLPLMQESDLDAEFAEKFGDLHYLDRSRISATSISYETQLSRYLTSVLVDDKLAEKVRSAFDAYIFLSYRKKDRKSAQELMRLIHKNDFCRDVAIWYDEFLVPGESFNDAIGEMLSKSDLFALAVTPNLVNEVNYVMTTEYPHACDQHKKMLVAEMQKTDHNELKAKYRNLPDCTDPRDPKQLLSALQDALGSIAKQEQNSKPEHLYYIGLAYLSGIDVEVDHERAVRLITEAADRGYSDAVEKLADMYRHGEGVARSYQKALAWQKKLVLLYELAYNLSDEVRKYSVYAEKIFALAGLYHSMRDYPNQKETLLKLKKLCESTDQVWGEVYMLGVISELADLAFEQGDFREAEVHLKQQNAFCKKIIDENSETVGSIGSTASILANGYYMLGTIANRLGDKEAICGHYLDALKIADQYAAIHDFTSTRIRCYNALASETRNAGDLTSSQQYLDKLKVIYDNLAAAGQDVSSGMVLLSESQNELKIQETYNKDLTQTYRTFRAKMSSDPEQSRKDFLELIDKLNALNENKETNVDRTEEVKKRRRILAVMEESVKSSQEIEDRHELAMGYLFLAQSERSAGDFENSAASYEKALTFFREYADVKHTPDALSRLLAALIGYGDTLQNMSGQKQRAYEVIREGAEIGDKVIEMRGTSRDYGIAVRAWTSVGLMLNSMGQFDEARTVDRKAIALIQKLIELDGSRSNRELLGSVWYQLGYVNGDVAPDKDAMLHAYKVYKELAQQYPDDPAPGIQCNKIQWVLMRYNMTFSEIDEAVAKLDRDDHRSTSGRGGSKKSGDKNKKKNFFSRLFGSK